MLALRAPKRKFPIPAPRGGGDPRFSPDDVSVKLFQSTLPVRGATPSGSRETQRHLFQSTLPVRGATGRRCLCFGNCRDFNPRSPCGERHNSILSSVKAVLFQSTLPVRGATASWLPTLPTEQISIHAPRAGSDSKNAQMHPCNNNHYIQNWH